MNKMVEEFYDFMGSSSELKRLSHDFFTLYKNLLEGELLLFSSNEGVKMGIKPDLIINAKRTYHEFMELERTPFNAFSYIIQYLCDKDVDEYKDIRNNATVKKVLYNGALCDLINDHEFIINIFSHVVERLKNFDDFNNEGAYSLFFAPFYMEKALDGITTFKKIIESDNIEYYLSKPYPLCITHMQIMNWEIKDFDVERKNDLIDMLEILTEKIRINDVELFLEAKHFIPLPTLPIIRYIEALNEKNNRSGREYINHAYVTQYYDLKYSKIFELFDGDEALQQFLDFFESKAITLQAEFLRNGVEPYRLIDYKKEELRPFPYEKIKKEWNFNMPVEWNIELLDL